MIAPQIKNIVDGSQRSPLSNVVCDVIMLTNIEFKVTNAENIFNRILIVCLS